MSTAGSRSTPGRQPTGIQVHDQTTAGAVGVLTLSRGESRTPARPCDPGRAQVEPPDHASDAVFQAGAASCQPTTPALTSACIPGFARTRHRFGDEVGAVMISHGTPRRLPARWAGCKAGPHTLRPAPRAGREASRREEIITKFAPREGTGKAWTNSKSVPSGQPRCSPAGGGGEARGGRAGLSGSCRFASSRSTTSRADDY